MLNVIQNKKHIPQINDLDGGGLRDCLGPSLSDIHIKYTYKNIPNNCLETYKIH